MKEWFEDKAFSGPRIAMVETINGILDEYEKAGYSLSLRQLYYQLVSRALIENTEQSYKRIGVLVSDGRLAGLIDWRMIVDRGRDTIYPAHWSGPGEIINAAAEQFRVDRWAGQRNHVEVMVEKQALEGVLEPVCRELDVRFTANKGYSSQSAFYGMGKRLGRLDGKTVHIFYLGDHDPSGLDMDRDVADRLSLFSGLKLVPRRLALTWPQIEKYKPPENPAKITDSRAQGYISNFGFSSYELDALEPRVLASLVRTAVKRLIDKDVWAEAQAREEKMRKRLEHLASLADVEDDVEDDTDTEDDVE